VLDPAESLFFRCRYQPAIHNQRGGGVAVKSVDAQNDHDMFMESEVSAGQRVSSHAGN
jgi:hypothetical protein